VSDILESTDIIDPWLYSTLHGDGVLNTAVGGRFVNTLSSGKVATPYVVFSATSTRAVRGVGGVLLDTDSLYEIKAVTNEPGFTQASALAARIKGLIETINRSITISTPFPASVTCFWETEIRYPEVTEGVQYRHLGGLYRIRACAL
jgi:hypothetical protein